LYSHTKLAGKKKEERQISSGPKCRLLDKRKKAKEKRQKKKCKEQRKEEKAQGKNDYVYMKNDYVYMNESHSFTKSFLPCAKIILSFCN